MIKNVKLWREGWLKQFPKGKILKPNKDPGLTVRVEDRLYWFVAASELGDWTRSAVLSLARAFVSPRFIVAVEPPARFEVLEVQANGTHPISWEPPCLFLDDLPAPFYLDTGYEFVKAQVHLGVLRGVPAPDWSKLVGVVRTSRGLEVTDGPGGICVECNMSVDPCGVHVVCS